MNSKNADKAEKWIHDEDRLEYAIDALVMSVQFALQKAMHENCISQKELATRIGVSPARVSQILSKEDGNLTLKTIGKISDALGEEFELFSLRDINEMKKEIKPKKENPGFQLIDCAQFRGCGGWVDQSTANDRFNVNEAMQVAAAAVGQ